MGELAVDLILEQLGGNSKPKKLVLPPEIIMAQAWWHRLLDLHISTSININIMRKSKISLLVLVAFFQVSLNSVHAEQTSNSNTSTTHDVSSLDWKLWGYRPNHWRMNFDFENLTGSWAEFSNIDFKIPGSVQMALKNEGLLEDWNIGLNSAKIEWIENRNWLITGILPDEWISDGNKIILECKGLDQTGEIWINGKRAGEFNNAFIPYSFDITDFLTESNNTIAFIFECPPRYLGQIGWTSQIKDWKPRFNYGWDWMPRIVQIGIWDKVFVHSVEEESPSFENMMIDVSADKSKDLGNLHIRANLNKTALSRSFKITLTGYDGAPVINETIRGTELYKGKDWSDLKIKRWWPNGFGDQSLYELQISMIDEKGNNLKKERKKIGFRNVDWRQTRGAPLDAAPWICVVNNQPIFMQGVNWTPIRPNFADLEIEDYRTRLKLYKDMGVNTIRIWGGGFPEKDWLYDLCDEMGIFIWQDFPLSSSGIDNYPPETLEEIEVISRIATHYVNRLHHHASLLLWCGGNELYEMGDTAPVTDKHPMIHAMKNVVSLLNPSRRFVPGSPSGPSIYTALHSAGKGIHEDVHGPWDLPYTETDRTMKAVEEYWTWNDAMIYSEVGVPGVMSLEMMNKYKGDNELLPASMENPLWRNASWWIQWDEYKSTENDLNDINAYITWSQNRQAEGLSIALKKSKDKFPECGGFIIWMGHDSFPCMLNTSIIDFEGNPKPVMKELSVIWKDNANIKNWEVTLGEKEENKMQ